MADLTMMWAGPYATKLLADYGAEVIKVEAPRAWDNLRTLFPPPEITARWWNAGAYFQEYNRNKKGLSLDLSQERGKELLGRLVAQSDIVIENYRAEVMDKLGLTEGWLRRQREDLVIVSMSGFGKTGPEARSLGYGPIIEEMSGLVSLTGYGDGIPFKTGISYGDPIAGIAAAGAAVTGLIERRRTGRGVTMDLAQREVVTSLIGEMFADWTMNGRLQEQVGNRHDWMAPHNAYRCAGEDAWIAIAVGSDAQWEGLRASMGGSGVGAWRGVRGPDPALGASGGAGRASRAVDARTDEGGGVRGLPGAGGAGRSGVDDAGAADGRAAERAGVLRADHGPGPRGLDGARLGVALDGFGGRAYWRRRRTSGSTTGRS